MLLSMYWEPLGGCEEVTFPNPAWQQCFSFLCFTPQTCPGLCSLSFSSRACCVGSAVPPGGWGRKENKWKTEKDRQSLIPAHLCISRFSHSAPLIPPGCRPFHRSAVIFPSFSSLDSGPELLGPYFFHLVCPPLSFSLCLPFTSWKSTWIMTGKWNQHAQYKFRGGKFWNESIAN